MQRHLYNGKELDIDFGLNVYFYGARLHDPAIGRFTTLDPISDRFAWVSTYNYAENRPVNGIDLHGLQFLQSHHLWKNNPEMAKRNAQMHQQSRVAGGEVALGFTPVGIALDIRDAGIAIRDRDAVGFGLAMIGFLPGGDIFKGRKILNDARKSVDEVEEFGGGLGGDDIIFPGIKIIDESNTAFKVAAEGGRHSGFLKNYLDKSVDELEKGIESFGEQIQEHLDKIDDPHSAIEGFKDLDPRQQKALIEKKWPSDINRLQEQQDILKGLLDNKNN